MLDAVTPRLELRWPTRGSEYGRPRGRSLRGAAVVFALR